MKTDSVSMPKMTPEEKVERIENILTMFDNEEIEDDFTVVDAIREIIEI